MLTPEVRLEVMNDREFAAALRDRDAILILSHLRPDGDTLGSGAALCSALRRTDTFFIIHPFAICVNAAGCKKIMTGKTVAQG